MLTSADIKSRADAVTVDPFSGIVDVPGTSRSFRLEYEGGEWVVFDLDWTRRISAPRLDVAKAACHKMATEFTLY